MQNKKDGKNLCVCRKNRPSGSDQSVEGNDDQGCAEGMKLVGQHSEGIGEDQRAAVGQGQTFSVKTHVHGQAFGKEDTKVVYADESDPWKSDGNENPKVVRLAETFMKVGSGGNEEISRTLLGLGRG